MVRGVLIETSARTILNQDKALRMLKRGKMTVEKIAEDTGLSIVKVEKLLHSRQTMRNTA